MHLHCLGLLLLPPCLQPPALERRLLSPTQSGWNRARERPMALSVLVSAGQAGAAVSFPPAPAWTACGQSLWAAAQKV